MHDEPTVMVSGLLSLLEEPWWSGVSSIASALALVVALSTALFTIRQFYADRARRSEDERMAQAAKVAAWISDAGEPVMTMEQMEALGDNRRPMQGVLLNWSDVPVYRVLVIPLFVKGAETESGEEAIGRGAQPEMFDLMAPGRSAFDFTGSFDPTQHADPGVELAFTDAAGRHWIRAASGSIRQLREQPLVHYGLTEPIGWRHVEPAAFAVRMG